MPLKNPLDFTIHAGFEFNRGTREAIKRLKESAAEAVKADASQKDAVEALVAVAEAAARAYEEQQQALRVAHRGQN